MKITAQGLLDDYRRIDAMMREKGVFVEEKTQKTYYTGYAYKTLYDWDQYFESLVELYLGWDTTYVKNGVEIFLDYQKENGHIQRSSQGDEAQLSEHVKPFLAQISLLVYRYDKDLSFLTDEYYERMKKYLLYWLNDRDENQNRLSVWDSAPHTGMDNQHERAGWWYDCFCEGVDLNAFLVRECKAFAKIAALKGKEEDEEAFLAHAQAVADAMQRFMWNEEDGIFYDVNAHTGEQIKVKHLGAFAAMWAGVATCEQASRMVSEHLLNPAEFYRGFLFPALAASEPGYSEAYLPGDLGCSWRAQTWIPTNYYVFQSLRKYGYFDLASHLASETYRHVKKIGDREYYNTESDTGAGLDPFWGWSLLAYFMPLEDELGYDPTDLDAAFGDLAAITVL